MVIAAVAIIILWILWAVLASPTKVAFLNYPVIRLGQISRANANSMIELYDLAPEDISGIGRYDMLLVNGMGLRITEEQREEIRQAAGRGLAVFTTMATDPSNDICSVDSTLASDLHAYLSNGGPANFRNMLLYIRRAIDGKKVYAPEPAPAEEYTVENIYHPSPGDTEGEEHGFSSIAAR